MEQLVATAADAGSETWLERLSAMGPGGAEAQLADLAPTDAAAEADARWQDAARILSEGWEGLRAELLDYAAAEGDARWAARQASSSDAAGTDASGTGEATGDVAGNVEVDVGDAFQLSKTAPDPTDLSDVTPEELPQVAEESLMRMRDSAEAADVALSSRGAALYWRLKTMPYGDGTLYDLFTTPVADVTGDKLPALYPAVASLSPGQLAVLEFLPAPVLVSVGAAGNEGFEEVSPERSNVVEAFGEGNKVSLYAGVERAAFSDDTALTSEALRAGADMPEWNDVLGVSSFSMVALGATVVSTIATIASFVKDARAVGEVVGAVDDVSRLGSFAVDFNYATNLGDRYKDMLAALERLADRFGYDSDKYYGVDNLFIQTVGDQTNFYFTNVLDKPEGVIFGYEVEKVTETVNFTTPLSRAATDDQPGRLYEIEFGYFRDGVKDQMERAYAGEPDMVSVNDVSVDEGAASRSTGRWVSWGTYALAAVTVVIAGFTIYRLASEIGAYYDNAYTKIPDYLVDEASLTSTDAAGNTVVVRNDSAYYRAARTNAARDDKLRQVAADRNDLNGDVARRWMTLYAARTDAFGPIRADSLKVVTGTQSVPEGYSAGIHLFGSDAAANLTDMRYTYNDEVGGTYLYYQREATAAAGGAPAEASAFGGGGLAAVSAVGGAVVGAVAVAIYDRRRRPSAPNHKG